MDEGTWAAQPEPYYYELVFKRSLTDGSVQEVYSTGEGTGDVMTVVIPAPACEWEIWENE